jgi:hypothetical protein
VVSKSGAGLEGGEGAVPRDGAWRPVPKSSPGSPFAGCPERVSFSPDRLPPGILTGFYLGISAYVPTPLAPLFDVGRQTPFPICPGFGGELAGPGPGG